MSSSAVIAQLLTFDCYQSAPALDANGSQDLPHPTPVAEDPETDNLPALPPPPPPTEVPTVFTASGRPWRPLRLPARYIDHLPVAPAPLPPIAPGSTALPRVILHVRDAFKTARDHFSIRREYAHRPSYDPDSAIPDEHLSSYYSKYQPRQTKPIEAPSPTEHLPPWPFQNMTTYLLMEWMYTGSQQKSAGEVDRLAQSVLSHPDFDLEDVASFNAQRQAATLDRSDNEAGEAAPFLADGWRESSVDIDVPLGAQDGRGLSAPFTVHGLHHRSLLSIMKAAITDVTACRFHFSPFKRFWKPSNGPEQRVFDEAYTSDAWIEEHDKLQKQSNEPDCKLEKVILSLMLWSDSTHLTSFGVAKLWPLYLYFGNLPKYFRGKPGSATAHHVAYIPSVSGLFS